MSTPGETETNEQAGESALPAASLALGEAISAVDRTVSAWLERHFTFLRAIRTGGFVHLARPATKPPTTSTWSSTERHVPSPVTHTPDVVSAPLAAPVSASHYTLPRPAST